jgi:hypothetical protein
MTVEFNASQSSYLAAQFNNDLKIFQNDISNESSKVKSARVQMIDDSYSSPEIKDEYIPSEKEEGISFEERLSQVISTEEMRMLLALVIRSNTPTPAKGQNVDLLG